jgi:hypothetical protein
MPIDDDDDDEFFWDVDIPLSPGTSVTQMHSIDEFIFECHRKFVGFMMF